MTEAKSRAVVLVSGGLDSATVLALAREQGFACYALSLDYGQRHNAELTAAVQVAASMGAVEHKVIKIDLGSIGGSALTDSAISVPQQHEPGIPVTYVPARNTIFLAIALGWAEVIEASDIFIGVNAVDYSGYPDCRPAFITAFERLAKLATKAGAEGQSFTCHTPLIQMSKGQIVTEGTRLGVDFSITVSCYSADDRGRACATCDACRLRAAGFKAARLVDPTIYQ
ncbi:MAG: 7-cyano-7-deazaguanine synthase QueC [Gammaproteobacteria bacterium]